MQDGGKHYMFLLVFHVLNQKRFIFSLTSKLKKSAENR